MFIYIHIYIYLYLYAQFITGFAFHIKKQKTLEKKFMVYILCKYTDSMVIGSIKTEGGKVIPETK